jgi:hypothetical protein
MASRYCGRLGYPRLGRTAVGNRKFAVIAGAVWLLLGLDDVGISELGLSRGHLAPAAGAFGAVWLALKVLGVGIATAAGIRWGMTLICQLFDIVTEQFGSLPAPWLTFVLLQFLIIGLGEEVTFRRYFQSKMTVLLATIPDSTSHSESWLPASCSGRFTRPVRW